MNDRSGATRSSSTRRGSTVRSSTTREDLSGPMIMNLPSTFSRIMQLNFRRILQKWILRSMAGPVGKLMLLSCTIHHVIKIVFIIYEHWTQTSIHPLVWSWLLLPKKSSGRANLGITRSSSYDATQSRNWFSNSKGLISKNASIPSYSLFKSIKSYCILTFLSSFQFFCQ